MNTVICPNCRAENPGNNTHCEQCSAVLRLNGQYLLLQMMDKATVMTWLGLDETDNQQVVIKEFSIESIDDWKTADDFEREKRFLSQLDHPAIPKLLDAFEISQDGRKKSYMVMDWTDGVSLKEKLKTKRYTEQEVIDVIIEVAKVLDYLHSLRPPMIHGKLNISTILQKADGGLVITGLDGAMEPGTKDGIAIPSNIGYCAPELEQGDIRISSDFYSLGIIALVLLTRKEPDMFIKNGTPQIAKAYTNDRTHILLDGLLKKDPNTRISGLKGIMSALNSTPIAKDIPSSRKDALNMADLNQNALKSRFTGIDSEFQKLPGANEFKAWDDKIMLWVTLASIALVPIAAWFYGIGWGLASGFGLFFTATIVYSFVSKARVRKELDMDSFFASLDRFDNKEMTLAVLHFWAETMIGLHIDDYIQKKINRGEINTSRFKSIKQKIARNSRFKAFRKKYRKDHKT